MAAEKEEKKEEKGKEKMTEKEEKKEEKEKGKAKDEKKEITSEVITAVYKVNLHCQECGRKIKKSLLVTQGIQNVEVDIEKGEIKAKGKLDPLKILELIEKKSNKKVELISPKIVKVKDTAPAEKKPKETKEPIIRTIKVKVHMHCDKCERDLRNRLMKHKGIFSVKTDQKAQTVTIEGTIEPEKLLSFMKRRVHKNAEIITSKEEKKGEEKEKSKSEGKSSEPTKDKNGGKSGESAKEKGEGKSSESTKEKGKDKPAGESTKDKGEGKSGGSTKEKGDGKSGGSTKEKGDGKSGESTKEKEKEKPGESTKEKGEGKSGGSTKEKGDGKTGESAKEKEKDKPGESTKEKGEGKSDETTQIIEIQGDTKVEVRVKDNVPYIIHYVYAPQLFSDENPNACSIL